LNEIIDEKDNLLGNECMQLVNNYMILAQRLNKKRAKAINSLTNEEKDKSAAVAYAKVKNFIHIFRTQISLSLYIRNCI
jgi:hypothetical protein